MHRLACSLNLAIYQHEEIKTPKNTGINLNVSWQKTWSLLGQSSGKKTDMILHYKYIQRFKEKHLPVILIKTHFRNNMVVF